MSFRSGDRRRGEIVCFPIRYADDFIILVGSAFGSSESMREAAIEEKTKLATALKEQLGLELSEAKTLVTPVTEPMRFLGHHVRVRVEALLRNRVFIEDYIHARDAWREGNMVAFPPGTYWLRRFANVVVAET